MLRPYARDNTAQLHHVTTDLDPELTQQDLADGAAGDARDSLAGAGALQDVAGIGAVVLERPGQVGMSGARAGHLAAPLAARGVGLGSHHVLPVLPVAIPDEHGDGGAEGLTGAHAGEPFDAVRLDLHAGAAAVAALAPFQLRVHALGGDGQAGGDPFEDSHQAAAVRFARRREPESHLLLAPPITGEPDRGRARHESVFGPEAARHYGLPHTGRRTGNGFGITGSSTMTTPLAVTPKSHCRVLARLRATRSGPMIGSRTGIVAILP